MVVGFKEVNKKISFLDIDDSLETLQKLVGGNIEVIGFPVDENHRFEMIFNEEGRLLDFPKNIPYHNTFIVGNLIISKSDSNGDFISLSENDIELIKEKFKNI